MTVTKTQVRNHFLKIKDHLDEVVYSLIRTQDHDMADEMFLRIRENEATFAQMARLYSEGPEARTGGVVGPVPLPTAHPLISEKLRSTPVGRVIKPFWVKQYSVILRVEDLIQARLEDHEEGILEFLEGRAASPS